MDKRNLQPLGVVESSILDLGIGLFFWLLSWVWGGISHLKESKMELVSLIIAGIAVLVTLFREEIRNLLKK